VLPGCLGGILLLIAWPPRGRLQAPWRLAAGGAAFALAFAASMAQVAGWTTSSPAEIWARVLEPERWQRTLYVALAAAAIGTIAAWCRRPRWSWWLIGAALAASTAFLLQPPAAPQHTLVSRPLIAVAVLGSWVLLEPLAQRRPGTTMPLALALVMLGAAGVLMQSRNGSLALLAAALATVATVAAGLGGLNRNLCLGRSATAVIAAMLPSLLLVGAWYDFGPLPLICFVLVVAAPAALWIGELEPITRRPPWQTLSLRVGIVTVPVALAVALALRVGVWRGF
jgi:hypothetical protein